MHSGHLHNYCIVIEEDDRTVDDGSGIVDVDDVMVVDDDTTGKADTTGTSAENITVTFGDVIAFLFSPIFPSFNSSLSPKNLDLGTLD